jgi:hypothetical protein
MLGSAGSDGPQMTDAEFRMMSELLRRHCSRSA